MQRRSKYKKDKTGRFIEEEKENNEVQAKNSFAALEEDQQEAQGTKEWVNSSFRKDEEVPVKENEKEQEIHENKEQDSNKGKEKKEETQVEEE